MPRRTYQTGAHQIPGNSLKRRARYLWSRLFGTRLQKSQRIYFVRFGEHRLKRVILRDSHLSAEIERSHAAFGESDRFPPLVARYENELWVEFLEGEPIRRVDDTVAAAMADFYAEVYGRRPREEKPTESPFPRQLERDLDFLRRVGVLSGPVHRDLRASLPDRVPERLWIGFDYTDAVAKNFVLAPESGRVKAVDVECLVQDELLGVGLAKALARWLEPHRERVLGALRESSCPPFHEYLPFVELVFLARWTKMGFLERKWKYVSPERFEPFRRPA